MSDAYPAGWTPWINHKEPVKVNGRSTSGLGSGCPDNTGWHENEHDAYAGVATMSRQTKKNKELRGQLRGQPR